MLGTTRTVRFAIIGYTAVALLVLSGLTWATSASLRLERATREAQEALREAQAQTDLRKSLEIARLRMDGVLWPVLIREISRPYKEYGAYYYDDSDGVGDADLRESPLRRESTESWITLYFQVTEEPCWTSPQLSPRSRRVHERFAPHSSPSALETDLHPNRITCVEIDDSDPVAVERKHRLDQLALAYTPEDFAERIAAVWNTSTNGWADGSGQGQRFGIDEDVQRRQLQSARLQQGFLPPLLECEPTRQVYKVTGRDVPSPAEEEEDREYFPVRVNEMAAVWLPFPGEEVPKLAVVRRVDIGSEEVYQGFTVDLAKLTAMLAPRLHDLFDDVKLEPALAAVDPSAPTTRLGALPVRLLVPAPRITRSPSGATLVGTTVAFAWGTAVIALAAIGLGVKRLVSHTERRKEFTYAVTHELRTPLTTFQLYTDMLAAGLVPEEKRRFYLETLRRESQRLSDLVTEVLEFARIENDAVHAHIGGHSVGQLMDTVRERYESRCRIAGLALSIDMNGTGDRALNTDPHIALQILGTLIDNACKYASSPDRDGGPDAGDRVSPAVQLRVFDAGGKLAIEVADYGPGISPKDRRDLFKPFRRGAQAGVGKAGGVGLGLALAKRWSHLIRGNLELVDRPEHRGACFRLTLPTAAP
ncbi:MAG: HAMP domain-containing sensor histidine kinase [Planctomycetota bacterium]